jgi:hypothetical protein
MKVPIGRIYAGECNNESCRNKNLSKSNKESFSLKTIAQEIIFKLAET